MLFSCDKNENDIMIEQNSRPDQVVDDKEVRHAVIIYAVNNSSLASDFTSDSYEILAAAKNIDFRYNQILLYKTISDASTGLYKVIINKNDKAEFQLIKEYDRDITSTAPERIKEVIDFALTLYPESTYDLIFWGHGMSWHPYFTDHQVDVPMNYAYGGEYTGGYNDKGAKETDWTEIDELAHCVPDHIFDTIWFDCCYMSGIEVIYEFKDKCKTFVGYPSEVWSDGLAYDLVLPYLLSDSHDVLGAAETFYNYYNINSDPVTIAVINMMQLEDVADAVKEIVKSGSLRPSETELVNYSRSASSPFYDFNQFFNMTASLNDPYLTSMLDSSLEKMVIYHAESKRDFNYHLWDTENISGISTHYYKGGNSANEDYYRSLKWFRRIYI